MIFRRRYLFYNALENFFHVLSCFSADRNGIRHINPDDIFHFLLDAFHVCTGKIHLIDDRNNFQVMIKSQIHIGKSLRLHALRCIDNEDRSFAG